MSTTSIRYMREKGQIELALQMIAYEARTHTIRGCTGLSDDRIRRLYTTYFKDTKGSPVRRQRGKSPKRTGIFMRNLETQRQSATLASLLIQFGLLPQYSAQAPLMASRGIAYGTRFCRAFAMYGAISQKPEFCFERAWSLCDALQSGEELVVLSCRQCNGLFVHDVLSLKSRVCPCCRIKSSR
ncbi:MAG: FlhC family transcriptional regulator [Gammaproteobacteria bacterium]